VTEAAFRVEEFYDTGRVDILSTVDPITLQAGSSRKRAFQDALGTAVQAATKGIFIHDVEVTLIWFIEEARRYQTHIVADLDNVMKATLDAVTGPDGVLIDDNQIQSIKASWMTPGIHGAGFQLTFSALMRDEYVTRQGLAFVEFTADRCYMLHGSLGEHAARFVASYRLMVAAYREMLEAGIHEEVAQGVLPIARPFPRARLSRFRVRHHSEFPDPAA
jgi:hypothetical protein